MCIHMCVWCAPSSYRIDAYTHRQKYAAIKLFIFMQKFRSYSAARVHFDNRLSIQGTTNQYKINTSIFI